MDCGIVKQDCTGNWVILSLSDNRLGWTGTAWAATAGGHNHLGLDVPLLTFPDSSRALGYAARHGIQAVVVGPLDPCPGLGPICGREAL